MLFLAAFLVKMRLLFMPGEAEKTGDATAFLLHVGNGVFVLCFKPLKTFPLPYCQPDISQVGVVPGDALETEKVHIDCVERDVLEITTQHYVTRIAQGDEHAQFGEHPEPEGEAGGRRWVFVHE